MSKTCPGAITDGGGMRLAVTAAESAPPMAPVLLRGDIKKIVADARAIGYQGLDIHVPDIWNFDADALVKACSAGGMAVAAFATGQTFVRKGLFISAEDPAKAAKAREGLDLFVDLAAKVKTGVILGWVRGKAGDRDKQAVLEQQAEALRPLDKKAKQLGVPLYIEVINRYELDTLTTTRETIDFIRKHELESTYVHLDTYHMNIDEYSFARAIHMCGPLLGYFHVAENTRYYPGHDRLNFEEAFTALREIGYDGFVSIECLPLPDGPEAAKRSYEYLSYRFF